MDRVPKTLAMAVCLLIPVCLNATPRPKGWVNDFAAILQPATQESLEKEISALERDTSAEVAVVTIPSLGGETIEAYANRLFNEWGIGKKGKNNGVLILVAPQDHRVRIEVGYGLEPILPDGLAGEIIRDAMTPAFKGGDFNGGVLAGTERVATLIRANQPLPKDYVAPLSRSDRIGISVLCILLVIFAGLGTGLGCGSKTVVPMLVGIPFLIVSAFVTWVLLGGATQIFLAVEGLAFFIVGYRSGRASSRWEFNSKRRRYARVWSFSGPSRGLSGNSKSSSSSSSGGSFGGGSSGGGGASGSW